MNSNQRTTETQQLKQQVLNDIQKVKDDLNEIKNRLTPGQIIDEAIYARRGVVNPADTFTFLKQNPIGTTFLTLGTLLLMEGENHMSYEATARGRVTDVKDRVSMTTGKVTSAVSDMKAKASQVKEKVTSKFHKEGGGASSITDASAGFTGLEASDTGTSFSDVKSEASSKFADVKNEVSSKVSDASANIQSSMSDAKSGIQSSISDAKSGIQSTLSGAKSTLSETAGRAKDRFAGVSDTVRSRGHELYESSKNLDPLTYLALGAGLGTITGASIPVSGTETQFFDSKFEDKISNFSHELQDALNQSVNILKNEFIGGVTNINLDLF